MYNAYLYNTTILDSGEPFTGSTTVSVTKTIASSGGWTTGTFFIGSATIARSPILASGASLEGAGFLFNEIRFDRRPFNGLIHRFLSTTTVSRHPTVSVSGTVIYAWVGTCTVSKHPSFINAELFSHWKGDDVGGIYATDSVRGISAILNGASFSSTVPPQITFTDTGSLNFTSAPQTGTIYDAYDPTVFTYAMWVKLNSNADQNIWQRTDAGGSTVSHQIKLVSNKFSFFMVAGSSLTLDGGTNVSPNTWYHVAAVFNPTTNLMSLYLNGNLEGTLATGGGVPWTGGDRYVIGGGAGILPGFTGLVDDIRFYNRPLRAAEILSLGTGGRVVSHNTLTTTQASIGVSNTLRRPTIASSGTTFISVFGGTTTLSRHPIIFPVSTGGIFGWWKFSDGANIGYDSTNLGNTATLLGGPSVVSGALSLNGTNQYAQVSDDPFDMGTSSFSFSVKAKITTLDGQYRNVVSKRSNSSYRGWSLFIDGSNNKFTIETSSTGNIPFTKVVATTAAVSSTEYILTVVFDRTSQLLNFYINTVSQGSVSLSGLGSIDNTVTFSFGDETGQSRWLGTLRDVKFYKRALSSTEATTLGGGGNLSGDAPLFGTFSTPTFTANTTLSQHPTVSTAGVQSVPNYLGAAAAYTRVILTSGSLVIPSDAHGSMSVGTNKTVTSAAIYVAPRYNGICTTNRHPQISGIATYFGARIGIATLTSSHAQISSIATFLAARIGTTTLTTSHPQTSGTAIFMPARVGSTTLSRHPLFSSAGVSMPAWTTAVSLNIHPQISSAGIRDVPRFAGVSLLSKHPTISSTSLGDVPHFFGAGGVNVGRVFSSGGVRSIPGYGGNSAFQRHPLVSVVGIMAVPKYTGSCLIVPTHLQIITVGTTNVVCRGSANLTTPHPPIASAGTRSIPGYFGSLTKSTHPVLILLADFDIPVFGGNSTLLLKHPVITSGGVPDIPSYTGVMTSPAPRPLFQSRGVNYYVAFKYETVVWMITDVKAPSAI